MKPQIPKLHLYHIPRTGGMSIGLFMRRRNRPKGAKYKHVGYHVNGHAPFRAFNPSYFTVIGIRRPVDHIASLYKYIKTHASHKQHKIVKAMSFLEYIDFAKDTFFGFLTPRHHRSIERAIANLRSVSFVYITDTLDRDMAIFLKYLNTGLLWKPTRFNATRAMKISKAAIEAAHVKRALDVRIYRAALELNKVQRGYFQKHKRKELIPNLDWSGVII